MASFTPTSSLPKVSYLRLSLASFAEASTGFSLRLTVALTDEFRSPPPPGPAKKVTIQLVEGRDGAIVGTVATNREIPGSPPFNKAFHVTAAKLASCVPASGSVVPDESAGKVYSLLFVEEIQQVRRARAARRKKKRERKKWNDRERTASAKAPLKLPPTPTLPPKPPPKSPPKRRSLRPCSTHVFGPLNTRRRSCTRLVNRLS